MEEYRLSLMSSKAKIHSSIHMTSFNEQFLRARKDAGEKKYETNSFCCWVCNTSRNKIHQHFVSVRKKYSHDCNCRSEQPLEKLSP